MVRLARSQPWSTAATIPLPSRISSRTLSKYTMKESAVNAIATISPTTPASESRYPISGMFDRTVSVP